MDALSLHNTRLVHPVENVPDDGAVKAFPEAQPYALLVVLGKSLHSTGPSILTVPVPSLSV
jgi:hypothetical protein